MKFYQVLQEMECLQGDTLPVFCIAVSGIDDLSGCSMLLILEQNSGILVQKSCTADSEGKFRVQLTSSDTAELSGTYTMHFRFTDANGLIFRKIAGNLAVKKIAQGG